MHKRYGVSTAGLIHIAKKHEAQTHMTIRSVMSGLIYLGDWGTVAAATTATTATTATV